MTDDWRDIDNGIPDPEWYRDGEPHEAFRRLRDEDPVHWTEPESYGRSFWTVTRYEHAKQVMDDPLTFSSYRENRIPRSPERLTTETIRALGFDALILTMDPPRHTVFRQPLNKHFSVPAIARLRDMIETTLDDIIADVSEAGQCEFVSAVSGEFPMRVVFRLMGIPEEDWDELRVNAWRFFAPADPNFAIPGNTPVQTARKAHLDVMEYSRRLARAKRAAPEDDLVTAITTMKVEGVPLDEQEIATWIWLLLLGGLETTRNAFSIGTWLFANHPAQRDLLRAQPDLAGAAVEEVLRWSTPARARLRVASADTTLGDRKIARGDWVVPFASSANRDERVFEDPQAFDISREPREHLALGRGIHLCLGRALARSELAIAFRTLVTEFEDLEVQGQPSWIVDHMINGFSTMEVAYRPFTHAPDRAAATTPS